VVGTALLGRADPALHGCEETTTMTVTEPPTGATVETVEACSPVLDLAHVALLMVPVVALLAPAFSEFTIAGLFGAKIREVAAEEAKRALEAIRTIPASVARDRVLRLEGIDETILVHRLPGQLRVLYRVTDVDHDGEDEVVILQILDRRSAEPIVQTQQTRIEDASEPLRLGHDIAVQLLKDD
jgi:hypothetical protein